MSSDSRSKQFLKILKNNDGTYESMVQRVWNQIKEAGLINHTFITTSKAQVEMIYSQIGNDINLIVEPERRDTFSAISLVTSYMYSIEGINLKEVIVVMPVDSYVDFSFFQKLKELENSLDTSGADLALLGVRPTYPSEKYGYIIPESNYANYFKVNRFTEKPHKKDAEVMINQSAFWNCGVFAFQLKFIIDKLLEKGLPIQFEEISKQYIRFPKKSFDYEVVEHSRNIIVLPYDGPWKDLGTWNTLTEEIGNPIFGKGIVTKDSINTHIINELDIPIAVIGASNLIVAASPEGILVSDKEQSSRIKNLVENDNPRPMYEERRWGRYRVLDYIRYDETKEVLTKRICIQNGKNLSYQYHQKRKEVWTIISGSGEMILENEFRPISPGDIISIPENYRHTIKANEDMEIIEVQIGSELIEDDIVRLAINWEEILQFCAV